MTWATEDSPTHGDMKPDEEFDLKIDHFNQYGMPIGYVVDYNVAVYVPCTSPGCCIMFKVDALNKEYATGHTTNLVFGGETFKQTEFDESIWKQNEVNYFENIPVRVFVPDACDDPRIHKQAVSEHHIFEYQDEDKKDRVITIRDTWESKNDLLKREP